ncbi:hypothetical protein BGZ58_000591 [Dissophora ornata]|nr:hypothetical protein BGZ58_000591 [Dissophora ornata]
MFIGDLDDWKKMSNSMTMNWRLSTMLSRTILLFWIEVELEPTCHIQNKEDPLFLLKKENEGGMEYKELKDSYSNLAESVKKLSDEGRILVVQNKDGMPRRVRIPDEVDLPKELAKYNNV